MLVILVTNLLVTKMLVVLLTKILLTKMLVNSVKQKSVKPAMPNSSDNDYQTINYQTKIRVYFVGNTGEHSA